MWTDLRAVAAALLALCCLVRCQAQHAFLEVAGSGGLGSLNYERPLTQHPAWSLHGRAGLSLAPIDRNNGTGIVLPLMVHGLYGKGAHHLDVGLGEAFTVTTRGSFFLRGVAAFGYRQQHPEKRMTFRVAYTPIIPHLYTFQWEHWAGISVGIQLQRP